MSRNINPEPRSIQVSPKYPPEERISTITSSTTNNKNSFKNFEQLLKMNVDTITSSSEQVGRNNRHNSRPVSSFGSDKKHCLCSVLKPLFLCWQIFGIFPISHNNEACSLKHSVWSIPAYINYSWILTCIGMSIWLMFNMNQILNSNTSGTDFYTYIVSGGISFLTAVMIYVTGFCSATHLVKGWDVLHSTLDELALPNFKLVKRTIYLIPIVLLEGFIIDVGSILYGYMNDDIIVENVSIVAGGSIFFSTFIPNLIATSYAVLIWIIAINFNAINKQVHLNLKELSKVSFNGMIGIGNNRDQIQLEKIMIMTPSNLSRLRVLHENLCAGVRHLETAFGKQILGIFCTTGFNFVGGIYGMIVALSGLTPSKIVNMTLAFSFSAIMSGLRLLIILALSQYLTNKANETGYILNSYDTEVYNERIKKQVDIFKRKIGQFPLKITCCNIFALSTSIIVSASSNITTYVLVLMQFKLNPKLG